MADRTARVVWEGDLFHGSGTIVETGSGAFGGLPVTWASRTEASDGKTSPEELIAAAHASCFSMALSNGLAQTGNAPESIEVTATCTFDRVDDGFGITRMDLHVRGRVPGIDAEGFDAAVAEAKAGCPVSRALAGNVEISATGELAA